MFVTLSIFSICFEIMYFEYPYGSFGIELPNSDSDTDMKWRNTAAI